MHLRNTLTTGLVEHLNRIKAKLMPFLAHGGGFGGFLLVDFVGVLVELGSGGVLSWGTKPDR